MWEASAGELKEYTYTPSDYGVLHAPLEAIRGGDAQYNATIFRAILAGEGGNGGELGPIRDAVLINAAAGLTAYRDSDEGAFDERYTQALADVRESIDSGAADSVLNRWIDFSRAAAE